MTFEEMLARAYYTQNKGIELERCPFCGADAYISEHGFFGLENTYGVKCGGCGAQTSQFYSSREDAARAWDRRA